MNKRAFIAGYLRKNAGIADGIETSPKGFNSLADAQAQGLIPGMAGSGIGKGTKKSTQRDIQQSPTSKISIDKQKGTFKAEGDASVNPTIGEAAAGFLQNDIGATPTMQGDNQAKVETEPPAVPEQALV